MEAEMVNPGASLTAPVIDASGDGWVATASRDTEPRAPTPKPTPPGLTGLREPSLNELADLARHGRLTDIERWIERHAGDAAQEPLLARLRELLEQFDFDAIHALAESDTSSAGNDGTAPMPMSPEQTQNPRAHPGFMDTRAN